MSLSDLASLGSFVSGVAVLVSLVFLFFQMRQMTEQVRQSERNQQSLIQQGRATHILTNILARTEPHLSAALAHLSDDHRTLSPSELQAYRAWLDAIMWSYEDSFLQHRSGTLSAKGWELDATALRLIATSAAFRTEWVTFARAVAAGEWRDYVDALIRDTPVDKRGGFGGTHVDWLA